MITITITADTGADARAQIASFFLAADVSQAIAVSATLLADEPVISEAAPEVKAKRPRINKAQPEVASSNTGSDASEIHEAPVTEGVTEATSAVVEPVPTDPPAAEPPFTNFEEVRAYCSKRIAAEPTGRAHIKALLDKFGAISLTDLSKDATKLAAFWTEVQA